MVEFWFGAAACALALYVVMDGFDLGAGALHLHVARRDAERRQVLAAIGPFWDGNEVWLLAAGGVLFAAFPPVLAAGLSGFYLAIFLVLWTLILRGVAIEFRSHVAQPLWRGAWDAVFSGASLLLAVLLGVALGNLLRGVPLGEDGWFALALFTDFRTAGPVGVLDWYTLLVGAFALAALVGHGGLFLAWKTDGPVQARSRAAARRALAAVAALWPAATLATAWVNPAVLASFARRPLAWILAGVATAGLATAWRAPGRGRHLAAFLGSSAFLLGLLGATAASLFPVMLRSTVDEAWSMTAYGAAVPVSALRIAAAWWLAALPLVAAWFAINFRLHQGPARAAEGREGY